MECAAIGGSVAAGRKLPVFRYEDKFIGSVETFDRIAAMLQIIPSATHRAEILAALEPAAVRDKIKRLEAAGSIRGEAIWDRETHWHANHVGDGRVGKFRDNLSVEQEKEILRQTREYCDHFGYNTTTSSRVVLNAELGGGQVAEQALDGDLHACTGIEDREDITSSVASKTQLLPGHQAVGDASEQAVAVPEGKRFIRLKEFRRKSTIINTPSDWYIAARDSSLIRRPYEITTDQDGFILPRSGGRPHGRKIVVIGDSVVESMYVEPDHRFCSRLEDILCDELGLDITVLNGGYGGTTVLHSLNVFLNKLIPIRPAAVILMTGIVDVDVAYLKASYWSHDCWLDPVVDATATNTWRDNEKLPCPSFDHWTKMLTMFATAGKLFDIPMGYATVPHRQVFSGERVCTGGI